MRGADGWSVQELLWLSDEFTSLLLRIFQRAEQLACCPEQLSTWVLVLLRKTDDACPGWSLIRPITRYLLQDLEQGQNRPIYAAC